MSRAPHLRVLVHLNSLELGGTQINAVDLAAALRGRGIESLLIGVQDTRPSGPSLVDLAHTRGFDIATYQPAPSLIARARQFTAMADRHHVDLVHVYGSWGGGAGPTYWGPARFGRTPWVQTVWEMEVSPKLFRHMPMIVGTGYQLEEQLVARPGRTELISPPVDMDENRPGLFDGLDFRSAHGIGDAPLLAIVSRLDRSMKSIPVQVAIEAVRALSSTGAVLALVGSGDHVPAIRAHADVVNDAVGREAVVMVGPLADPRPAYGAADIVLGMGGSAARALAFGKPLVVTGERGWSEVFEESSAASLAYSSFWSADEVPDPDVRLASVLAPLLADPARRAALGAYGRAFAVDHFGLPAMAERLDGFYRATLDAHSRRRWLGDMPREGSRIAATLVRTGSRALRLPTPALGGS